MADQPFPDLPPLPASAPAAPAGPTRTSGLAVTSLVLGILSCPLSILAGIPGLICGIMGINQISRSERGATGPRLTGQGMAITGITLSSISLLILPVMMGLMLPAMQAAREAARQSVCSNNLRSIAFAMHDHETASGLIPAAITDADGKPLLSWRVAILPSLEEKALYDDFHLDEPWDSPHNRALIPRMPAIYACPSADVENGKTRYLLVDGPGSAFEQSRLQAGEDPAARIVGARLQDIENAEGAAVTLMVVEAPGDRAVEWTRPEELPMSPADASRLEEQRGGHSGGIRHGVYVDGHVEHVFPGDY